jgi:hypothetical protein
MSMYRIHARVGDCSYSEVCFADDEVTAQQIAFSMFGEGVRAEYVREMA